MAAGYPPKRSGETYWAVVAPIVSEIDLDHGEERFLETYGQCDPGVALLFATHYTCAEICNGGFTQFFGNSTGILAPEAVAGFIALGMAEAARQIELAMEMLGLPYERDRSRRIDQIGVILDREHEANGRPPLRPGAYRSVKGWRSLEDLFFQCVDVENDGFEEAADKFVRLQQLSASE